MKPVNANLPGDFYDYDFTPNNSDFGLIDDLPHYETSTQLESPIRFDKKTARREFKAGLKKEALTELIPTLPPPDTDLWLVSNGDGAETGRGAINLQAFDFGSFIPHVVRLLGNDQCRLYISTWTCNRTHVLNLLAMLREGELGYFTFCCDPYFRTRETALCTELLLGMQEYPDKTRAVFWKNHAKIIAIANQDETQTCVIVGSANLSAQPRAESYVMSCAPEVYKFYRDQFFEAMIANARD